MKWLRRYWPYLLLLALVACNIGVWLNRDRLADWWRLRDYQAPTEIAALATDTTMTDWGIHLFYVNHPVLEDKDAFNEHCSDYDEKTAVLGCYHGDRQGIYLYAVTDARLDGVRQVTAAHEMLHQAYDRLSSSEKDRVNTLLQNLYDNELTDEDIRAKLDAYKEQGADLLNEMHSIFATEIVTLNAELEDYYKEYFSDRAKVVGYEQQYRSEFTRREELAAQYEAQMSELKSQFDTNQRELSEKLAYLNNKESEVNQALQSGDRAAYETAVDDYNTMVKLYNAELAETRKIASQYNDLVAARNEIIVQENELQKALDSSIGSEQQEQ